MPPSDEEITKLYSAYKALTGLEVPYTMQLRFTFEAFIAAGFNEPDLACVVRYIKGKIKEGKRPKESLLPRNLIQRTDFFAEDLAISRAEARNTRTETPRQAILRATGRPEQPSTPPKAVKSILEGDALKEFMLKCKQEAGLI